MVLPKLYRPVRITFHSLASGYGSDFGVIFDVDVLVSRECRRVLVDGGWEWQIVNRHKIEKFDPSVGTDHECLNADPLCFSYWRLADKESGCE